MATNLAQLLAQFAQNAPRDQARSFPPLRQFEPSPPSIVPTAMESGGLIAQDIMRRSIAPRFFEDSPGKDETGQSQTPTDIGPDEPSRSVDIEPEDITNSLANAALGLGLGALGPLGNLASIGLSLSDVSARDIAEKLGIVDPQQISPEELANLQIMRDLGAPVSPDLGFGVTQVNTPFGSFNVDTRNLDVVGFPDDPELANMTFTEAWEATFGGGRQGSGLTDEEQEAVAGLEEDTSDVGTGIGGDEAASSSGEGEDKVICAELYRQGVLPRDIYEADEAYGKTMSCTIAAGYHLWAIPFVGLMRRYRAAFWLGALLGVPWAYEVAWRSGLDVRRPLLGRILHAFGVPVCRMLGRMCLRRRRALAC